MYREFTGSIYHFAVLNMRYFFIWAGGGEVLLVGKHPLLENQAPINSVIQKNGNYYIIARNYQIPITDGLIT